MTDCFLPDKVDFYTFTFWKPCDILTVLRSNVLQLLQSQLRKTNTHTHTHTATRRSASSATAAGCRVRNSVAMCTRLTLSLALRSIKNLCLFRLPYPWLCTDFASTDARWQFCPSVRSFVCLFVSLSVYGNSFVIVSSPMHTVAQSFQFYEYQTYLRNSDRVTSCVGAKYRWGIKISRIKERLYFSFYLDESEE